MELDMLKFRVEVSDVTGRTLAFVELSAASLREAADRTRKWVGGWPGCDVNIVPLTVAAA
jgi:hypothetical protein